MLQTSQSGFNIIHSSRICWMINLLDGFVYLPYWMGYCIIKGNFPTTIKYSNLVYCVCACVCAGARACVCRRIYNMFILCTRNIFMHTVGVFLSTRVSLEVSVLWIIKQAATFPPIISWHIDTTLALREKHESNISVNYQDNWQNTQLNVSLADKPIVLMAAIPGEAAH